jgi:hypothetical protein
MVRLPDTHGVAVVRTAFGDDGSWSGLVAALGEPGGADGFLGNFSPVDDVRFDGLSADDIVVDLDDEYRAAKRILLVFDRETEASALSPLLAVDLGDGGRHARFRVTPQAAHTFEMNIAVANMDFSEYARWADDHGGLHSGFG